MINDIEDMFRYTLASNGLLYQFYHEGTRIYYDLFSDGTTVASKKRRFVGDDAALFAIVKYFSKVGDNPYYNSVPHSHLSSKIKQLESRFASRSKQHACT